MAHFSLPTTAGYVTATTDLRDSHSTHGSALYGMALVYTLGLCRVYYTRLLFVRKTRDWGKFSRDDMDKYLELLAGYQQWPRIHARLERDWKAVCAACVVILPLSIAFVQLDGVMDSVLARTMGLAALIYSSSGLIASGVYLMARINLLDVKFRGKWIEASSSLTTTRSIKLWICIVSPVVFFVWSVIFCVLTLLCIAWSNSEIESKEQDHSGNSVIIGAAFLTFVLLGNFFQVYHLVELVGIFEEF